MILHLIHDDRKIIPRMISQFEEVYPGYNIFLCVVRSCDGYKLNYLEHNSLVINSNSEDVSKIPWEKVDKICIHYLNFSKLRYLYKILSKYKLKKCKIIWFIWSGDIYDIIERKGYNLYANNNSYLELRKYKIRGVCSFIKKTLQTWRTKISDFAICYFIDKRIDYIVCNSIDEFQLFSEYIKFSRCKKLLNFSYYPIEDTLGDLVNKEVNGDSIIIGNSASESNNHEYILQIIQNVDLKGRKIYVPLSYGENANYIKVIEEKYSLLNNVVIMKDFLPIEQYNSLLLTCNTFVYGNYRSEGWGNILVALYLGGKVYVSKKSFLAKYLAKEGYKFFLTEEIKETLSVKLSQADKIKNRNIAFDTWSRFKNRQYIKCIINI